MGQLTNQFVSSSYQGLLNLENPNSGVTSNLQNVTDGLGNNIPMKVSNTEVVVSGSFYGDGTNITGVTALPPDNMATTGSNTFNGNQIINGDISISGSIVPQGLTSDLGSPSNPFRDVYVSSGSLYLEDHQVLSLSNNGGNTQIAAPDSGSLEFVNDIVFKTNFGSGVDDGGKLTIAGGGPNDATQTVYSGSLHYIQVNGALQFSNIETDNQGDPIPNATGAINFDIENSTMAKYLADATDFTIGTSGSNVLKQLYGYEGDTGHTFYQEVWTTNTGTSTQRITRLVQDDSNVFMDADDTAFPSQVATIGVSTGNASIVANNADIQGVDKVRIIHSTGSIPSHNYNSEINLVGDTKVVGNEVISGSLTVTGNITAVSASVDYAKVTNLEVVYETSSVIFSSGSNIFGDEASDVQTLNGTVNIPLGDLNVSNALTASGLIYPTVDNGAESFIQTDGNGNLSLQYVKTLYQNIRNMETSSIALGTPLFVSGQTGDNADVFIADASNPLRRPSTLIAGDATLAPSATGKGIISGHIEGVDTNLYPAGTIVYLKSGGGWTSTRPTGSVLVQALGVVTKQANNGQGIVFNQIGNNLPNIQDGYIWIGDSNQYPTAKSINEIGIAITGSNSFVGQQNINGNVNITGSLNVDGNSTFDNQTTFNQTIQYNADSFIKSGSQLNFNIGDGLDGAYYRLSRKVSGEFGIVQDPGNHHILDISTSSATFDTPVVLLSGATGSFYGSGENLTGVTAAPPNNMATTGSNTFIGDQTITGSIRVKGDLIMDDEGGNTTILLNQNAFTDYKGYYQAWLEPTNKVSVQAFERDINLYYNGYDTTGGTYDNGLFIDVDSSGITFSDQLLPSYSRRNWLNIPGGASSSPQFKVGLGVTGSLYVSGSDATDATVEGKMLVFSNSGAGNAAQIQVSGSYAGGGITTVTAGSVSASSGSFNGILNKASITHVDTTGAPTTNKYVGFSANPSLIGAPSVTGVTVPSILAMNGSAQPEAIINFQHRGAYTDGTMTVLKPTDFKSNVNITGSILQSGSLPNELTRVQIANSNKPFYGDANTLLTLVGDSVGKLDFYADGGNYDTLNISVTQNGGTSFNDYDGSTYPSWLKIPTNTGSNPAPQFQRGLTISGSLVQSGSVNISGSVSSEVKDITVSSLTGSIDLNTGNFFNVPLGTASSDIRLEFSNVKPGQTVNVKVVPDSTNTVSFGPNVLQPSGSSYVPTQTSGSIDVLTLVSFDSTNLLLASVNNLI